MTLLAGRGGADGQGVIRRVRDPNTSSGQRQVIAFQQGTPPTLVRADAPSFRPLAAFSVRAPCRTLGQGRHSTANTNTIRALYV